MWHGTGSLGPGKSVCRVCRRKARPPAPVPEPKPLAHLTCPTCGTNFTQGRSTQVYCSPECRPRKAWRNKPRNPDKYGPEHAAARRTWKRDLEDAGQLPCSICGGPVRSDEPWHLDHVPGSDTEYRGVSHPACNISDGARMGALKGNRKRTSGPRSIPLALPSGRTAVLSMNQCADCNASCFGTRCRPCHLRRLHVSRTEKRPNTRECLDCEAPIPSRRKRCVTCALEQQRMQSRLSYRKRVGIPLDAPLAANGRKRNKVEFFGGDSKDPSSRA